MSKIKVAIFDDSADFAYRFEAQFQAEGAECLLFFDPLLDQSVEHELVNFRPDLIVTDACFGESREEGIRLIRCFQRIASLRTVPIIVITKLINDSPMGKAFAVEISRFPGVIAALPKYHCPPICDLLKYVGLDHGHDRSF